MFGSCSCQLSAAILVVSQMRIRVRFALSSLLCNPKFCHTFPFCCVCVCVFFSATAYFEVVIVFVVIIGNSVPKKKKTTIAFKVILQ